MTDATTTDDRACKFCKSNICANCNYTSSAYCESCRATICDECLRTGKRFQGSAPL